MKISPANKEVLITTGKWWIYVMVPIYLVIQFIEPTSNSWGLEFIGAPYMWFLFWGGAFNAVMDKLQFHFSESRFKNLKKEFWDPSISWLNKYKNRDKSQGRTWVPVIFTDAWHLFKAFHTSFICLGVIFFIPEFDNNLVNYLAAYGFYKWGFNLFYNFALVSKNKSE